MAWTTPRTWTSTTLTAAQMNTDVRDNSNYLATDKAMWNITRATYQSVATATNTEILWDAEHFDNSGVHSLTTNTGRVTCAVAGKYQVNVAINWSNESTAGYRYVALNINGSPFLGGETAPTTVGYVGQTLSTLVSVTAGQYLTVVAYQNSGVAVGISGKFSGFWVGF